MNQLQPFEKRQHAKRVTTGSRESQIDHLARQLCSPKEISRHFYLQEQQSTNGHHRLRLFPVWWQYRWKAQRITELRRQFPLLDKLPLSISSWLCDALYQ